MRINNFDDAALYVKQMSRSTCFTPLNYTDDLMHRHYKPLNKYIAQSLLILFLSLFFHFCAFPQAHKIVTAKKGDGIYVLLKRHGISPTQYMNAFIKINQDNLEKNNALIAEKKYKLPVPEKEATVTGANYAIFGKGYSTVKRKDNSLKGAVYYLVSGHGGSDPGAIGKYGKHKLCEDEYAYDVTLRLARNLVEHGALVYMITRDPDDGIRDRGILKPDKDETCYPNLRIPHHHLSRLRQRKNTINKLYLKHKGKKQRLLIIHVDSRSKRCNIDVFFYYDKRSNTGKQLATNLLNTFNKKYRQHQPGRGYEGSVSPRNLYVLKHTYVPAVFIELGNINHQRDQVRFIKPDNRQALANWLTEGLKINFTMNN